MSCKQISVPHTLHRESEQPGPRTTVRLLTATCLPAETPVECDHAASVRKYHTYSWIGVNVAQSRNRRRRFDIGARVDGHRSQKFPPKDKG